MNSISIFQKKLFKQVDAASLAVFRIGFGLIMVVEVWRYWQHGWIDRFYIQPQFMFKYYGFEWVQAWPGDGMYYHFAVIGISALFVMAGFLYRLSIIVFTLAFAYLFLLDQALYLNHFYLVLLVSILLCIIPAHKTFSVDAWIRPAFKANTVSTWPVWLLRAQFETVLLFAGIVKINADWLHLEPLSMWLAKRADFPFFGYFFTQEWSVAIAAYGIIILHIVGAPLLFWKRTRLIVFILYGCFHILNHFVFNIGIFPWFTLFGTLLFFDPDWPRQLWARISRSSSLTAINSPNETAHQGFHAPQRIGILQQKLVLGFFAVWISTQILIPLRHFLYPGNVSWTEEGHRFSWQMKLRSKSSKAEFYVVNRANRSDFALIDPHQFLDQRQARTMAGRPDMVLQFAHFLAKYWQEHYNLPNREVLATVFVSLNGRQPALLINPGIDLAKIERSLGHADWILPLKEPLPHIATN